MTALPAFHLIARKYPTAERILLSNLPHEKEISTYSLIAPTGLVNECIDYERAERDPRRLWRLRRRIRALDADAMIYLVRPSGRLRALRDLLFFWSCGIRSVLGIPLSNDRQRWKQVSPGQYELESSRLARCLAGIGDLQLSDPASWDVGLRDEEDNIATACLASVDGHPFIAASVGSKVIAKDWGQDRWLRWSELTTAKLGNVPLVFVGGAEDRERSDRIGRRWTGLAINLCGKLTSRISAAVLKRARCFVGHDSGPMHLAAAGGTPCVALFGAYNKPRIWHPHGVGHIVLHKSSLDLITPDEVANSTVKLYEMDRRVEFNVDFAT